MKIRVMGRLGAVAVGVSLGLTCIAVDGSRTPAGAESLRKSLARAYMRNPQLGAERARQRATDEAVPQALDGWRPTVTASGDYGVVSDDIKTRATRTKDTRDTGGFSISLSQPVFEGFRTLYGTKQAEATVEAGRQTLLNVQQTVLLDGVTAYMNVIRDRTIVALRRKNVAVLNEQLRASKARFNVGEITRTDVAQARARLSQSQSNLAVAKSNLAASAAFYVRVFGVPPRKLYYPKRTLAKVPKSLKRAIRVAEEQNPTVLAASFTELAARYAIKVAKGNLLPTLSLAAEYSLRGSTSSTVTRTEAGSVVGSLSVPLYQGGGVFSSVREAKHTANQRRLEILDARRIVRQNVVTAWNNIVAAREAIRAAKQQVSANALAFSGVKQEALVGSRTTLDVLDAEQELVDSRVSLVQAQRELIVARYQLIAAIGRLTAESMRLPVTLYDPTENYHRVRDKLFGTDIGESE
ncbi:MAG: TolC family outer membrane protein [Pseudomonadota bacterium]